MFLSLSLSKRIKTYPLVGIKTNEALKQDGLTEALMACEGCPLPRYK